MQLKDVNNLKVNVYATLAYFDIFDFPLKIDELEKFLLWTSVDRQVLWAFLNNDPNIQRHGDFYFFKGRREIIEMRKKKEQVAAGLWKKVRRFVPLLKAVPYIRMVAVCNSLATNNTDQDSDIDLFIVAKKGRLFEARTFVTLLFSLLGLRRHGKKVKGRFCLSFFVSDDSLGLKGIKEGEDDIYLPYWILTLKPVFGMDVHERMMEQNDWIRKYFPHRQFKADMPVVIKDGGLLKSIAGLKEKVLNGKIGDSLENYLAERHFQRHQRKLSALGPEASVVVSDKMLKFHNVDRRKEIARRFGKRFEELMDSTA